jgi:hypothetical protein
MWKSKSLVLAKLANGIELTADDRNLPRLYKNTSFEELKAPLGPCWFDEWKLVQEHFDNSRSKKVLSIIQQQK